MSDWCTELKPFLLIGSGDGLINDLGWTPNSMSGASGFKVTIRAPGLSDTGPVLYERDG